MDGIVLRFQEAERVDLILVHKFPDLLGPMAYDPKPILTTAEAFISIQSCGYWTDCIGFHYSTNEHYYELINVNNEFIILCFTKLAIHNWINNNDDSSSGRPQTNRQQSRTQTQNCFQIHANLLICISNDSLQHLSVLRSIQI